MKCCQIREIDNMMQIADRISRFFSNSPKRQLSLESWINSVLPTEEKRKEMCRTRWIERLEAFEVFVELFLPIFSCLEHITCSPPAEWNWETRSDAQSLLLALSQFSFIFVLVLTQRVLAYTKGLSIKLQGRYVDVVRAHQDIEAVIDTLKGVRSRVDVFHTHTFQQVVTMSQNVDVSESTPRRAGRQQHRQNIPSDNSSDYYKLNLTIPLLDHLISELDARFSRNISRHV